MVGYWISNRTYRPQLGKFLLAEKRLLCKAGCCVMFDDDQCNINYNGKVILHGYIDPSTDLWTQLI
jgi:hypothetical protein